MDALDQQAEPAGDDRGAEPLTAPTPLTERAPHDRPWAILVPALVVVFVAALDLTVIAPILPAILYDLRINTAEADRYVWIVSGYLLAYTVTIPLMGRLSDLIGRRETFGLALVIFLAGSAVCAEARTLPAIIAGRAIQGLGGGAMVPVAMALVGDLLAPGRRAAALGVVAAVDTLGWVLGPIWGAAIERLTGEWRAIFALNLPIGIVAAAILLVAWHRAGLRSTRAGRPDLLGALLLTAALVALNLGVSASPEAGTGGQGRALGSAPNPLSAYRLPLVVAGLALLAALVVAERRARHPLIPLQIFRRRQFSAANATNALVGAALMVAMVNVPLTVALLVAEDRVSTLSAELLGVFSLTMGIGALAGGRLAERAGYRTLTWLGLAVAALGFWRMTGWPNAIDEGRMLPDLAVAGLGFGVVIAPIGAAAINAARREHLGIASGLVIVMRLLGMTLGISALTAWAVGRLNAQLAKLPPLAQQPNETFTDYLARQQQYAVEHAIPLTLGIIRDTFAAAAIICLLAAVPAILLSRHGERPARPPEP